MSSANNPGGEFIIRRGTSDPETWQRYVETGRSIGALVVEVEPDTLTEQLNPADYASRSDFIEFAASEGTNLAQAAHAYRGLLRIYDEQRAAYAPIAKLPHLKFDPEPTYEHVGTFLLSDGLYDVELSSLRGFLDGVDTALEKNQSAAAKLRFQERVLPRMVGLGTVDLYKRFIAGRIDTE